MKNTTMKSMEIEEDDHLNLRLGLPGSEGPLPHRSNKRAAAEEAEDCRSTSPKCSRSDAGNGEQDEIINGGSAKTQVVGWPPIRSYRKNNTQLMKKTTTSVAEVGGGGYVKVSVDGAPYLRKIDLKVYKSYPEFLKALENMFHLSIGKRS